MTRLESHDQLGPVFLRASQRVLIEGCSKRGRDDGTALVADAGQGIAAKQTISDEVLK